MRWLLLSISLLGACGEDVQNPCPEVEGLCPALCGTLRPLLRSALATPPEVCPTPEEALGARFEIFLGEGTSTNAEGCTVTDDVLTTADECGYTREVACTDESSQLSLVVDAAGAVSGSYRLMIGDELCAYTADTIEHVPYSQPEG